MNKIHFGLAAALLACSLVACSPIVDTSKLPLGTGITNVQPEVSRDFIKLSDDLALKNDAAVQYGSVLVKTNKGFDTASFTKLGAKIEGKLEVEGAIYWKLSKTSGVVNFIQAAKKIAGVAWAEPELVSELSPISKGSEQVDNTKGLSDLAAAFDDPAIDRVYSLSNTEAASAYADSNIGYGTNNVYVAIIDSGINRTHEEFSNGTDQIIEYAKSAFSRTGSEADGTWVYTWVGSGSNFATVPLTENYDIDNGHGTHVAGTIAARGNNAKGFAGVAWKNTKIISYKCFAENGDGSPVDGNGGDWSVYGAIHDLVAWKIATNVTQTIPINMSLGGAYAGNFELEMINYGLANNVVVLAAMGNEGYASAHYPSAYNGVIAIGASDARDEKVNFSISGEWCSVLAPGHNIYSVGNNDFNYSGSYNDDYQYMSGTSMATPFATGMVTYLLSFNPTMTPDQIKSVLEITADDIGAVGFDIDCGYGRVNVNTAANLVKNGTIPVSGSRYSSKAITVKVRNTNSGYANGLTEVGSDQKAVVGQPVYLYKEVSSGNWVFQGVGLTGSGEFTSTAGDEGSVSFKLLAPGTYKAVVAYFGELKELTFTDFGTVNVDSATSFEYNKPIVFIATVANAAFPESGADTIIDVYTDETLSQNIGHLDQGSLDTLQIALSPNTDYWVKISAYVGSSGALLGEYGLQIGFTAPSSFNNTDGTRAADTADSHEVDNDGAAATLKGSSTFTADTPYVLGASLLDDDVFKIHTP